MSTIRVSTIADASAALAATGSDSGANVAASVIASFSGGKWTVSAGGIWQGPPGKGETRANDYYFKNATATTIDVATQRGASSTQPAGVKSSFLTYDVLAFDGTHVLLGQGIVSPNNYGIYYLVSDSSLKPGAPGVSYPLNTLVTSGAPYAAPPPACYAAGTRILTERGEVAVEDLVEGDLIAVMSELDRVLQPVVWIGHRRLIVRLYDEPTSVLPVRIRRGAFAEAIPARDLLVSPDHAIYCDGVLIQAKLLINGGSIVQDHSCNSVHYFHVELARHGVIFAEGLAAESYLDGGNRGSFQNNDGAIHLHPDFSTRSAAQPAFCHRLADDLATVQPIWSRLATRAQEMGFALPEYDVVTDPELRLEIAGRAIRPCSSGNGRYAFVLPFGTEAVRLVSRNAIPGIARPWMNDHRRLGVLVARIAVRTGSELLEVALDSPDLRDGWWPPEYAAPSSARWTNGRGHIALPAFAGSGILEICLAGEPTYLTKTSDTAERHAA